MLMMLISGVASALPHQAGPHVVDIDLRNSTMQLIPQAKASVSYSDGKIRIFAWAKGYLSTKMYIEAGANPAYFKREIVLADPDIYFEARNGINAPLSSVYFNRDQYGVPANKYRISAFIPKGEWRNPTVENLHMTGGALGNNVPFSCTIELVDEFYRVDFLLSRRALAPMEYNFTIFFKSAGQFSAGMRNILCRNLTALSASRDPESETEALSLCNLITRWDESSPELAGDNDPDLLKRFRAERSRFDLLHEVPGR